MGFKKLLSVKEIKKSRCLWLHRHLGGNFTALYGLTIMKQDETVQCIGGDSGVGGGLGGLIVWGLV